MNSKRETPKPEDLLARYEALLRRSSQMLAWAKEGEWESLIEEKSQYLADVENLSKVEAGTELDRRQQIRRANLMERILEHSLEIQRHLAARREFLGGVIESTRQRHGLDHGYLALQGFEQGQEPADEDLQ